MTQVGGNWSTTPSSSWVYTHKSSAHLWSNMPSCKECTCEWRLNEPGWRSCGIWKTAGCQEKVPLLRVQWLSQSPVHFWRYTAIREQKRPSVTDWWYYITTKPILLSGVTYIYHGYLLRTRAWVIGSIGQVAGMIHINVLPQMIVHLLPLFPGGEATVRQCHSLRHRPRVTIITSHLKKSLATALCFC